MLSDEVFISELLNVPIQRLELRKVAYIHSFATKFKGRGKKEKKSHSCSDDDKVLPDDETDRAPLDDDPPPTGQAPPPDGVPPPTDHMIVSLSQLPLGSISSNFWTFPSSSENL